MMRILLVDDENELVSTLSERLQMRGFEADWATDAENALSAVIKRKYDVAILDVKIPRISGLNLKRRMEKLQPKMKFIFMTGHGSEKDFRMGVAEAGEAFYLVKPVKIDTLIEKIHSVLKTGDMEE